MNISKLLVLLTLTSFSVMAHTKYTCDVRNESIPVKDGSDMRYSINGSIVLVENFDRGYIVGDGTKIIIGGYQVLIDDQIEWIDDDSVTTINEDGTISLNAKFNFSLVRFGCIKYRMGLGTCPEETDHYEIDIEKKLELNNCVRSGY